MARELYILFYRKGNYYFLVFLTSMETSAKKRSKTSHTSHEGAGKWQTASPWTRNMILVWDSTVALMLPKHRGMKPV